MHAVRSLSLALIAAFGLWIAFGGVAATAQPQVRQVELNEEMVERFLASYPQVQALGKKFEKEHGSASEEKDNPVAALSGYMQFKAAREELETILQQHDFETFVEWLDVARSVALAYGFVKSGKTPDQLGNQAEQALSAIRDNPNLTAEQKKQMETMVNAQLTRLKQVEPSAQNIAIVQEMQPRIAAVIDSE